MGGRGITFCDCLETAPHCDSRCLFLHKVYYHFEGRQIWNGEFLAPFEGRLSVQFDLKEIMAVLFVNQQKYFEVINSPCYHNKELASPEQTATGKDVSNPFMAVMTCQMSYSSSTSYDSCSKSGKWFQSSMDLTLSGPRLDADFYNAVKGRLVLSLKERIRASCASSIGVVSSSLLLVDQEVEMIYCFKFMNKRWSAEDSHKMIEGDVKKSGNSLGKLLVAYGFVIRLVIT
ncbi:hypothetical protein Tco_0528429 [Tanacetum coccineum]